MDEFKTILQLNNEEAKKYFLAGENYFTMDLPSYFKFDELLREIDAELNGRDIHEIIYKSKDPNKVLMDECEGINHQIITNKDACYGWRPLQLINPVIYVLMVNLITRQDNWEQLKARFSEFQNNSCIKCVSIPVVPLQEGKKVKAEQISAWWHDLEQKSLEQTIEFPYVFLADIENCYSSIYTHSIAWAILGKDKAKALRNEKADDLGNTLDRYIQRMSNGQTNGIPQGSNLMNLIAEIVLGYADLKLSEKINERMSGEDKFYIVRYRDDYRIFADSPVTGQYLVKLLAEVLMDLGLQLNTAKTFMSDDIISAVVKPEKIYWLEHGNEPSDNQNYLLLLYKMSKQFPNSGVIKKLMIKFCKNMEIAAHDNLIILMNIIIEIACYNPKLYSVSLAIISRILPLLENDKLPDYIKQIKHKFEGRPNSGEAQIWLQRITYRYDIEDCFSDDYELLCKLVHDDIFFEGEIWNNKWIKDTELKKYMKNAHSRILDFDKLYGITKEISQDEIDSFYIDYF